MEAYLKAVSKRKEKKKSMPSPDGELGFWFALLPFPRSNSGTLTGWFTAVLAAVVGCYGNNRQLQPLPRPH